ncbi:MAG: hypothetical protein HW411_1672 [Gammaproteobacteria bacterium]|nr:hypothetical protein [Gammaproteobacteria bacterium]
MNNYSLVNVLGICVTLLLSQNLYAGNTTKHTGTIYASPVKQLMPLGSGDGVMTIELSGIASLSGEPPSILTVDCAGLGIVAPDSDATTDFYCTFKESDEDIFDIKGTAKSGNASFDVIGGGGKWTGATGKGQFTRTSDEKELTQGTFEVDITTK